MPMNTPSHPTKKMMRLKLVNQVALSGLHFLQPVVLILLVFMAFSGCVDIVADIEFPNQEPKVVVHSFISPADTAVQVMVSWSNPIEGGFSWDTVRLIDIATVSLTKAGRAVHL